MDPYISIVVTSRNDNHGGDALKRMNIFMQGLIHQMNAFQLPAELVFVDWNPPSGKPLLQEILPQPKPGDFLSVRYVQVPYEYHKTLHYHDRLNLYQMIAKNVGIRRASADFIVCTNIDLLFSDELMEQLCKRELKPGYFYRANRCDVPSSIQEDTTTGEQLAFCRENILHRNGLDPAVKYDPYKFSSSRIFTNPFFTPLANYLRARFWRKPLHVYHQVRMLDMDTCGDFTLMHKNDWERIHGYYELEMYSLHIDSIALMAAHAIGLQQVTFPTEACTYHIEHSDGWMNYDPLDKIRFYERKPTLDWNAVMDLGMAMATDKKALTVNKETWGLRDERLEETSYPS